MRGMALCIITNGSLVARADGQEAADTRDGVATAGASNTDTLS